MTVHIDRTSMVVGVSKTCPMKWISFVGSRLPCTEAVDTDLTTEGICALVNEIEGVPFEGIQRWGKMVSESKGSTMSKSVKVSASNIGGQLTVDGQY